MELDTLFMYVSGYERVADDLYRLYVDGPVPTPQLNRRVGERTHLFHLFAGPDAERIEAWLASHRAWQCLRVPTYTREKGVRAVLAADRWRGGDGSALSDLGRDRTIRDEAHRRRIRHEVELLIGMVLENPVRPGELEQLHDILDTVNAGPVGVELATGAEVIDVYFGAG
ncbi:unnamed protein product [Gemmataceae bacterium]|nr:unnamed protein product [Gemmataceae bacterium]VTT96344.1 unnamed protein product [Gemmataceae bacterium]